MFVLVERVRCLHPISIESTTSSFFSGGGKRFCPQILPQILEPRFVSAWVRDGVSIAAWRDESIQLPALHRTHAQQILQDADQGADGRDDQGADEGPDGVFRFFLMAATTTSSTASSDFSLSFLLSSGETSTSTSTKASRGWAF